MESPHLGKLFHQERKDVAQLWVWQTFTGIRRIMREHAEAARRSADLEFTIELRLLLQYSGLLFICGLLFVLIQFAGPVWLRGLALHADRLSQHIADAQEAFNAATDGRDMRSMGTS
jgi:hypothetical protein